MLLLAQALDVLLVHQLQGSEPAVQEVEHDGPMALTSHSKSQPEHLRYPPASKYCAGRHTSCLDFHGHEAMRLRAGMALLESRRSKDHHRGRLRIAVDEDEAAILGLGQAQETVFAGFMMHKGIQCL